MMTVRTSHIKRTGTTKWTAYKGGNIRIMEIEDTLSPLSLSQEKADLWYAYYKKNIALD